MIPTPLVRELMERLGVPGIAVGVIADGEEEVAGFGVTSLEHPLPVTADTLFQAGSITKTFTATAVMRLVESGLLDLDEPVRTYLPALRLADEAVARRVTMRHLLSHTGGWAGDYFDPIGRGEDALARMVARLDGLDQLTPLGQVWSYNNAGFYIAGRVIEIVTGEAYESALRALVLKPLTLEHSFFFAEDVITHRFAVGHDRVGKVARPWAPGRTLAPVGGLITSVCDLLRYARLQWEPDGVLSVESIAEMRRPQADTGGGASGDAVGLGWYLARRDGHSLIAHSGGTTGQMSLLVIAPEDRFAVAMLTNHDNGAGVCRHLRDEILQAVLGLTTPSATCLKRSPDELLAFAGTYEGQLQTIQLSVSGPDLMLNLVSRGGFPTPDTPPRPGAPATRCGFVGPDRLITLDPPREGTPFDFLRDANGEIAWLRLGGRLHKPIRD